MKVFCHRFLRGLFSNKHLKGSFVVLLGVSLQSQEPYKMPIGIFISKSVTPELQ